MTGIGHVENRDVFKSLVAKMPVNFTMSLLGFDSLVINFSDSLTNVYSKNQEKNADLYGVEYVNTKMGNVGCINELFQLINENQFIELFSSHPQTDKRVEYINKHVSDQGYQSGECEDFK